MKIKKVDFEFIKGDHSTLINTSGNPGHTILNQYLLVLILENNKRVTVNLKSDLQLAKRITKKIRNKIIANLKKIENKLKLLDVKPTLRKHLYAIKTHWQKRQYREYEYLYHLSIDDKSLNEVKKVLLEILNEEVKSESNKVN